MQDIKLTAAVTTDIPAISALAKVIWNQYYPAIITEKQINYMLQLMYSRESLMQQMIEKGHLFYFIELNAVRRGFISIVKERSHCWHLNKFYIDQSLAGIGIGSKAFNQLIHLIQPEQITLTVNRQNFKAINFYFKSGFKIEAVADFDIGEGFVMNDFVMKWVPAHS